MLFMKMDLLNYQYLDKMNNNIGILCYEGNASLPGAASGGRAGLHREFSLWRGIASPSVVRALFKGRDFFSSH